MAQKTMSLAIFFVFLVVLLLNFGKVASETVPAWCVAKPSTMDSILKHNIEFACSHVEEKDCDPIREGTQSPCYYPNTLVSHAPFAMNIYYQRQGMHDWDCNFQNSGLISLTNPSYSGCTYLGGELFMESTHSGMWCVMSASTSDLKLQNNIDYACQYLDCSIIYENGACHNPNSLISHASMVMNLYYQQNQRLNSSCDFAGSGLIVTTDPSYSTCTYEYRK